MVVDIEREDIAAMPDGSTIWIKWDYCRGPQRYTICHDGEGVTTAHKRQVQVAVVWVEAMGADFPYIPASFAREAAEGDGASEEEEKK